MSKLKGVICNLANNLKNENCTKIKIKIKKNKKIALKSTQTNQTTLKPHQSFNVIYNN